MSEPEKPAGKLSSAAGTVAIILAAGLVLALNIVTVALMYAAWTRLGTSGAQGLSENGTQLLTGAFGGIIGALSGYLGYTLGKRQNGRSGEPPGKV